MPGYPRNQVVREGEIGTYHCWSGCVQQAYLCGQDQKTGIDFDYRREYLEQLLEYQARVFAVDLGNHNLLSNHAHLIARTRPDIAALWSLEEVAWRWRLAWPSWENKQWVRVPTDPQIEELLAQPERLAKIRQALASLSWFMARWKEPFARLCNAEVGARGHFWAERFSCRELLDEAAVLTCSVYVDLNQCQAGMATTLEDSRHSAIYQRVRAAKAREVAAALADFADEHPGDADRLPVEAVEALYADCWLAPITTDAPLLMPAGAPLVIRSGSPASGAARPVAAGDAPPPVVVVDPAPTTARELTAATGAAPVAGESLAAPTAGGAEADPGRAAAAGAQRTGAQRAGGSARRGPFSRARHARLVATQRRRASDDAILAMPFSQYLAVVAATLLAKCGPAANTAEPPPELVALLSAWGLQPRAWLAQLQQLEHQCPRALGKPPRMAARALAAAQQWFQGIRYCRDVFS